MSDFFSGSKPDLISLKSINDLAIIVNNSPEHIIPINCSSRKWDPKSFFNTYIKPNIVPIVLILVFLIALLIRYFMLKENNEINTKEDFNAAQSVFEQPNHNNYISADTVIYDLEDNIDENELMEKIMQKQQVKSHPFDEHVIEDKVREVHVEESDNDDREIIYKGRDDWLNQFDGYENPFFGNNMVTSTASAVQFGLKQNNDSVDLDKMARKMFG